MTTEPDSHVPNYKVDSLPGDINVTEFNVALQWSRVSDLAYSVNYRATSVGRDSPLCWLIT